MKINFDVKRLSLVSSELGLAFDEDLFMALWLSLVAKRNILVASSNAQLTAKEIKYIMRDVWGIRNLLVINCNTNTEFTDVKKIIESGVSDINGATNYGSSETDESLPAAYNLNTASEGLPTNSDNASMVVLFIGLELTTRKVQQQLLNFIEIERVKPERELFTLIPIIESKKSLEIDLDPFLLEAIWFRQTHTANSSYSFIENSNSISSSEISPVRTDFPLQNETETNQQIKKLRILKEKININPDISRYIYDIMIFARMHRMVSGGLPTYIRRDLEAFVTYLAAVNGYQYIIPKMVVLACQKLLPLKLRLVSIPEEELTLMYGSDIRLIREVLPKWNADLVVKDVIDNVQPPI
ncbi:hypothetical protein B5S33_g2541 [[Candida] boidinii]|nr:hypothetical protein B5S33_g2541 [[Candida] boidinii]